jgi:hypothetical protein
MGTKATWSAALCCVVAVSSTFAQTVQPPPDAASFAFPAPLSSALPFDVDEARVGRLVSDGRIAAAQRLFEVLAWQTFVALSWPSDEQGRPLPGAAGDQQNSSPRAWEFWIRGSQVFKPKGAPPDPFGSVPEGAERTHPAMVKIKGAWRQNLVADQNLQAFSGPLVDQNGHWVRYEVLLNDVEYDYIVANRLYNQEGQAEFLRTNAIDFPANDGIARHGAIEVKLAWKEMGPADIRSRFFVRTGTVLNQDTGKYEQRELGLVGMHIAMRTRSSPTWIWSTFEHVDNVRVKEPELVVDGRLLQHRPSFYNPDRPTDVPNVLPPPNVPGTNPTGWSEALTTNPVQVVRVIPIDPGTEALNAAVQSLLAREGSVFQYYELIGTQWPSRPFAPAIPGGQGSAPESIIRKTTGEVLPVYLTNMTMETYFQKGVQPAGPLEQDDRLAPGMSPDNTPVFGTESCVGCHYSAGATIGFRTMPNGQFRRDEQGRKIPIIGENANFGRNGNANYSWLLQIEARSTSDPN